MTYRTLGNRFQRVRALAELPDMRGKVALVTGGTDGVGRAIVDQLATTGATLLLTARDAAKGAAVRDAVRAASRNDDVVVVDLDLSRVASVREASRALADGWDRLDLLICNAAHQPTVRTVTADGFETTFGVNHIGHAALVRLLLDRLTASEPSRIVIVASEAHRRSGDVPTAADLELGPEQFRPKLAYNRSKLANILYARELARQLFGTRVAVNALHPGGVDTPMMRANFTQPARQRIYPAFRRVLITPEDSAAAVLRVALDPSLDGVSGRYFSLGVEALPSKAARDDALARDLWRRTDDAIARGVDG